MKYNALRLAVLMVCVPFAAHAVDEQDFRFETTQNLYNLCSEVSKNPDYAPAMYACRAFIEGAVQYHDAVSDQENLKRLICYGEDTTISDGQKAFLDWVEQHKSNKELMEELPVIGLVRALGEKYPCAR